MRTGKRLSVPARYWWLRSPNPWNANNVRNVNPSGALNNNNANNGYGLAAACCAVGESFGEEWREARLILSLIHI